MAARTKSVIKQSEAELQRFAVKYIKAIDRDAIIIANPFSELQLHGSENYRNKVLGNMKAAGWDKSQPDLIIKPSIADEFVIELKTKENDPFRKFRNGPGLWIEKTKDEKGLNHVIAQAWYLHRLNNRGVFSCFASGEDQVKAIINHRLKKKSIREAGYDIPGIKLMRNKYIPEYFLLPYLKKI